ncbi:MAG: hypothetical protein ABR585_11760 [Gemmatimonadaceae bacterium]
MLRYISHIHPSQMNQPLAEAIFWIAAIACVVGEIAIVRAAFGAGAERKSEAVPATRRSSEIAWALIPAMALSLLLVVTWRRVEARSAHLHMDHSTMDPSMPMPGSNH